MTKTKQLTIQWTHGMKIIKFSALVYNKFYQQYTILVIVPNANIAGTPK